MNDDTPARARAIEALEELFLSLIHFCMDIEALESQVIDAGHECMAEAFARALEGYDDALYATRSEGLKVHDIRKRTLATEIGDVCFCIRRYRDVYGCDRYLIADVLDIPYGMRISPGARNFLVNAGANVSYAKAASLLSRHGSSVSPVAVMGCMRQAGLLCAEDDGQSADALYENGVLPQAKRECESISVEADGTYVRLQKIPKGAPKRAEIKAMVAYGGKTMSGKKVRRRGCVHHALIGASDELWKEGVAAIGQEYNLAKIRAVHLGADGERWCKDAKRFFPRAEVVFHLDPFHINHAILSAVPDKKLAWNIIDVVKGGDKREALALLRACRDLGLTRKDRIDAVISYVEGNIDSIAVDGPSLGTMESENQHLYGVRMDAFPCAWSVRGASDMARIISRKATGREIPKMTRERSVGESRRKRHERKQLAYWQRQGMTAGNVVEFVGSGYLPPHQVNTRRIDAGKAYVLYKGIANLDGRI